MYTIFHGKNIYFYKSNCKDLQKVIWFRLACINLFCFKGFIIRWQYKSLLILPEFFVLIKQDAWPIPLQNWVHVLWPVDVYQNRNKPPFLLESFVKRGRKSKAIFCIRRYMVETFKIYIILPVIFLITRCPCFHKYVGFHTYYLLVVRWQGGKLARIHMNNTVFYITSGDVRHFVCYFF